MAGKLTKVTHAGGIVYRLDHHRVRYLLVRAKKDLLDEWLLPKGHIEDGETPRDAALREVREETGIVARVLSLVGSTQFKMPSEDVYVKYYLMQMRSKTRPSEMRRSDWFLFEEALEKLTHDENKRLLREAERQRENQTPTPNI